MLSKEDILKDFVSEVRKIDDVTSVIQIGSSLWDEKSKDIDVIIILKGKTPSFKDLSKIKKLKHKFSKRFGVSFGMGGLISEIRQFNIDLIIIPEDYKVYYSFNPLLIYGMSLNPYKVLYGADFFKRIKKGLKKDRHMLFKFGGTPTNYFLLFVLGFDGLDPKNSAQIISTMKMTLYPLIFQKDTHVPKKEMIPFLKKEYPFFRKLCEKYKIRNDLVYKKKLSNKEIHIIYSFLAELAEKSYEEFY